MWLDNWASSWPFNFKVYDSGWKVCFAAFLAFGFILPISIVRGACRGFFNEFKWYLPGFSFVTYLDTHTERVVLSGWWKDCRWGMWGVYRGPFGVRIVRRSRP